MSSSLLQWLNKLLIILIFIVFLSKENNALELAVSPPKIDFKVLIEEIECKSIKLNSYNRTIEVFIEDYWKNPSKFTKKRDIRDFNMKIESLLLNYPKKIIMENEEEIEVCFEGKKEGQYQGALIINVKDSYAAIGVWVNVEVINNKNNNILINKIKESISDYSGIGIVFLCFLFYIFLLGFLIWIYLIAKKEKQ